MQLCCSKQLKTSSDRRCKSSTLSFFWSRFSFSNILARRSPTISLLLLTCSHGQTFPFPVVSMQPSWPFVQVWFHMTKPVLDFYFKCAPYGFRLTADQVGRLRILWSDEATEASFMSGQCERRKSAFKKKRQRQWQWPTPAGWRMQASALSSTCSCAGGAASISSSTGSSSSSPYSTTSSALFIGTTKRGFLL